MLCPFSAFRPGLAPILPPSAPRDSSRFPVLSQLTSSGTSSAKPRCPVQALLQFTGLGSSLLMRGLAPRVPYSLDSALHIPGLVSPFGLKGFAPNSNSKPKFLPHGGVGSCTAGCFNLLDFIFLGVYSGVHCMCMKSYWLSQLPWMWYRGPPCEASNYLSTSKVHRNKDLSHKQLLGRKSSWMYTSGKVSLGRIGEGAF